MQWLIITCYFRIEENSDNLIGCWWCNVFMIVTTIQKWPAIGKTLKFGKGHFSLFHVYGSLFKKSPRWMLSIFFHRYFPTRRCQSNQSNAESIERNWTQWNDCDSIVERNRNSIEYYPGFAVRLSNVIESIEYYGNIEYYGKFQFDWFDSEELTETERHTASFFKI